MEQILTKFPELELRDGGTKVHCNLSGHEMPCRVDVLNAYVRGKKFLRLQKDNAYDYVCLRPLIVASQEKRHALYCRLTGHTINRIPLHVQRHIAGRKFQAAKAKYNKGERQLLDIPEGIKNEENLTQLKDGGESTTWTPSDLSESEEELTKQDINKEGVSPAEIGMSPDSETAVSLKSKRVRNEEDLPMDRKLRKKYKPTMKKAKVVSRRIKRTRGLLSGN